MDGEVTDGESSFKPSKKSSFADYFEEWFPFYLNCGMTYDQYWNDDSSLVIPYFRKYTLWKDDQNFFSWLNGFYNFVAFSTALSNMNFDGKHRTPNKYLEKPADIRPKTEEEEDMERQAKLREAVARLNRFHTVMGDKLNGNN